MNQFESQLKHAQRQQFTVFVGLGAAGLAVIAVVFAILVFTNGVGVRVQPAEAELDARITVIDGWAIATDLTVYTIAGVPKIRVEASGFQPAERSINAHEKGGVLSVLLQPLPGILEGQVSHGHKDTAWSVDGQIMEAGSNVRIEREAGEYQLLVTHPYFLPYESKVTLERGKILELEVEQERVSGRLSIGSDPSGADVYINGDKVGTTPSNVDTPGGKYAVALKLDGFQERSEDIEITNDLPMPERKYLLQRLPAELIVEVMPSKGRLLINGQQRSPGDVLELPSETPVQVSYFKEGFIEAKQTLALQPGERRSIKVRLEPARVEVTFQSRPPASVYVNGKEIGTSPIKKTLLSTSHRAEFRKPGYRTVRKTFTPTAGSKSRVSATLLPELEVRLKEQPSKYETKSGITMRRFRPDEIQMGAPRSELGQRANEFQRTVRLTRIFYASVTEVTNKSYRQFKSGHGGGSADPDHPAVGMTWHEAARYCNWLSAKEGLKPFYRFDGQAYLGFNSTADGYRLLTEAEWEWLARKAGRRYQTKYPWGDADVIPAGSGNIADESANGAEKFFVPNYTDGFVQLAPVGSFKEEPSGLQDLFGNASEWVHDVYDLIPPDAGSVETNRFGPIRGESHVIKGSSFRSGRVGELRPSYRRSLVEGGPDVGFRIARFLYGGEP